MTVAPELALRLLQLIALALPAVAILLQVTHQFAETTGVKIGGAAGYLKSVLFGSAVASFFWFSLSAVLLVLFLLNSYYGFRLNVIQNTLFVISLLSLVFGIGAFLYLASAPIGFVETMVDFGGVLTQLEKAEAYQEMGISLPELIEELISLYYSSTVGELEALKFLADWEDINDVDELKQRSAEIEGLNEAIEAIEESDQHELEETVGEEESKDPLFFRIIIQAPNDVIERFLS